MKTKKLLKLIKNLPDNVDSIKVDGVEIFFK